MILIADSGSTKTSWCVINSDMNYTYIETSGLNPCLQAENVILDELQTNLCPQINCEIKQIFYYGTGVTAEKQVVMTEILKKVFLSATTVEAYSDLLGSARSVCGNDAGIACILGTGSNSCLFDGNNIIDAVNCGGYILGDEGSGAVLGRNLLNAFLKRDLSEKIHDDLVKNYNLSYGYIVEKVYKTPMPNTWMASFTKYLNENQNEPCIRKIIVESFEAFFAKNVEKYDNYKKYQVHFIGSIAYHFKPVLEEIAKSRGIAIGNIIQAPITELANYHKKHSKIDRF
ncbi:MAG: ATPase [Prevotellaceae bacterium]|jgi:N-acetylglucosamine kinase-like BadF-type ATPase|nr:ATPase [Prevotellaceae bacterium]